MTWWCSRSSTSSLPSDTRNRSKSLIMWGIRITTSTLRIVSSKTAIMRCVSIVVSFFRAGSKARKGSSRRFWRLEGSSAEFFEACVWRLGVRTFMWIVGSTFTVSVIVVAISTFLMLPSSRKIHSAHNVSFQRVLRYKYYWYIIFLTEKQLHDFLSQSLVPLTRPNNKNLITH